MNETCVFCKIITGEFSCYKIYEDDIVMSFLSIDPVTYGHTLVIPKKHVLGYEEIDLETLNHINKIGKEIYQKIKTNLNPSGIKIVQNNGSLQEVKHYHMHIIPVYEEEKENKKNFDKILNEILRD